MENELTRGPVISTMLRFAVPMILAAFVLLGAVTALLNVLVFAGLDGIIWFLRTPEELKEIMKDYLIVIFAGLVGIFLYNFFASLLRSLGNSVVPLAFLAVSALLNIGLDLWFVAGINRGVAGAAEATVISQYVSGIGIAVYTYMKFPELFHRDGKICLRRERILEITNFSALTCMQQSIMNFGILAVQGLVNSFGTTIMAAFAAAVKIDAFAYLPVQDFGNAFSIFIAQNYGAGEKKRIHRGMRAAVLISVSFGLLISLCVFVFAVPLMSMFIDAGETAVISEGVRYLRIEGIFYFMIGILFLLYGLYRALGRPGMSVVLTLVSLGTRVALAYSLSAIPALGVVGIWWSVPVGWFLADALGIGYLAVKRKKIFDAIQIV